MCTDTDAEGKQRKSPDYFKIFEKTQYIMNLQGCRSKMLVNLTFYSFRSLTKEEKRQNAQRKIRAKALQVKTDKCSNRNMEV